MLLWNKDLVLAAAELFVRECRCWCGCGGEFAQITGGAGMEEQLKAFVCNPLILVFLTEASDSQHTAFSKLEYALE